MDQIRTGRFIAAERKAKGLTQKQLAEKMNISDKTVSKWECGNGFPEVSLLEPLCSQLDITVNELLAGERVNEQDYIRKAEENMMDMIREKEINRKRMAENIALGTISTITMVTMILVVSLHTEQMSVIEKSVLMGIGCTVFAVGIWFAMQGVRTIGYYKCRKCGSSFVPNMMEYTMSMHMVMTKYLKCPDCGEKTWCRKVYAKEEK